MGTSRAVRPIRDAVRLDVIKKPKILGLLLNGLRLTVEANPSNGSLVEAPWSNDAALAPRREYQFPVCLTGSEQIVEQVDGSPRPGQGR